MSGRNFTSRASKANDDLRRLDRHEGEDNLEWAERAFVELSLRVENSAAVTWLLLVGGADTVHVRLRFAQSPIRRGRTPGHFSHVAIVDGTELAQRQSSAEAIGASTGLFEVSLDPGEALGYPPETNGVRATRLERYRDPASFPNIALLYVPAPWPEVRRAIREFKRQPDVVNEAELITAWLSYVWGVKDLSNPLRHGLGIPSAVFVESVIASVWRDLTPGLASSATSPEAIWQGVRWWYDLPADFATVAVPYVGSDREAPLPPGGRFAGNHRLVRESDDNDRDTDEVESDPGHYESHGARRSAPHPAPVPLTSSGAGDGESANDPPSDATETKSGKLSPSRDVVCRVARSMRATWSELTRADAFTPRPSDSPGFELSVAKYFEETGTELAAFECAGAGDGVPNPSRPRSTVAAQESDALLKILRNAHRRCSSQKLFRQFTTRAGIAKDLKEGAAKILNAFDRRLEVVPPSAEIAAEAASNRARTSSDVKRGLKKLEEQWKTNIQPLKTKIKQLQNAKRKLNKDTEISKKKVGRLNDELERENRKATSLRKRHGNVNDSRVQESDKQKPLNEELLAVEHHIKEIRAQHDKEAAQLAKLEYKQKFDSQEIEILERAAEWTDSFAQSRVNEVRKWINAAERLELGAQDVGAMISIADAIKYVRANPELAVAAGLLAAGAFSLILQVPAFVLAYSLDAARPWLTVDLTPSISHGVASSLGASLLAFTYFSGSFAQARQDAMSRIDEVLGPVAAGSSVSRPNRSRAGRPYAGWLLGLVVIVATWCIQSLSSDSTPERYLVSAAWAKGDPECLCGHRIALTGGRSALVELPRNACGVAYGNQVTAFSGIRKAVNVMYIAIEGYLVSSVQNVVAGAKGSQSYNGDYVPSEQQATSLGAATSTGANALYIFETSSIFGAGLAAESHSCGKVSDTAALAMALRDHAQALDRGAVATNGHAAALHPHATAASELTQGLLQHGASLNAHAVALVKIAEPVAQQGKSFDTMASALEKNAGAIQGLATPIVSHAGSAERLAVAVTRHAETLERDERLPPVAGQQSEPKPAVDVVCINSDLRSANPDKANEIAIAAKLLDHCVGKHAARRFPLWPFGRALDGQCDDEEKGLRDILEKLEQGPAGKALVARCREDATGSAQDADLRLVEGGES